MQKIQNLRNGFYLYKGHKIYEPQLFTDTRPNSSTYGQKYWNYCPFEISSKPDSGYLTKEKYYKADQQRIDEKTC